MEALEKLETIIKDWNQLDRDFGQSNNQIQLIKIRDHAVIEDSTLNFVHINHKVEYELILKVKKGTVFHKVAMLSNGSYIWNKLADILLVQLVYGGFSNGIKAMAYLSFP